MLTERLLTLAGFIYEVSGKYYYMGKWICKPCMCRQGGEEPETNMYFQKIRAFSDFALEVPYNPEKIKADLIAIEENLSEAERESLKIQIDHFEEDIVKYCG